MRARQTGGSPRTERADARSRGGGAGRILTWGVILALAAAAPLGCSASTTTPQPSTGTSQVLSGTADFKSGPLPSDAEMQVRIVDNSATDTATATLGETTVTAGGKQAPLSFEVPYDLSRVDPNHLYAVQATITAGGQTLFATKGDTLVITQGRPTAGVTVSLKQP